jgi:hypothetical protein
MLPTKKLKKDLETMSSKKESKIIMTDIEKIIESKKLKKDFVGSVPESEILNFEKIVGHKLPDDFRTFLEVYGCGTLGPFEIYGLGVPQKGVPNIISVGNSIRKNVSVPSYIVPFMDLGDGLSACVVCKNIKNFNFGDIIVFDSTRDFSEDVAKVLNKSFTKFIKDL